MRREHVVPVSTQVVAILKEANALTGHGRYLFPSVRTSARPISEKMLNAALRRLGYTKGRDDRAHWQERVRMAQWWSDHLDELRHGGNP
jgi:integrase